MFSASSSLNDSAHDLCVQRKDGVHMNWAKRILWYVFGAASAGLLIFISSSHAVESGQSLEQRVTILEQKVSSIEERHKVEDQERKAANKGGHD